MGVFEKIQESKNLWFWVLEKLESNTRRFWVFENNAESTDCLFQLFQNTWRPARFWFLDLSKNNSWFWVFEKIKV